MHNDESDFSSYYSSGSSEDEDDSDSKISLNV